MSVCLCAGGGVLKEKVAISQVKAAVFDKCTMKSIELGWISNS